MMSVKKTLDGLDVVARKVNGFLQTKEVNKIIQIGTSAFTAAATFLEKPTWWNAGRAVFTMAKTYIDENQEWTDTYFEDRGWTRFLSSEFTNIIILAVSHLPSITAKTNEKTMNVKIVKIADDVEIGWLQSTRLAMPVEHLYVDERNEEKAHGIVKDLLWKLFAGKPIVMKSNKKLALLKNQDSVSFEFDDIFESQSSQKASEYSAYLKRCIDAGVNRSVMLYGPPGTGKSTLARTLINTLGMRSLRIRIEDAVGIDGSTIAAAVDLFEPGAIILDDFDRAYSQVALLETLEFFQRHVKLVVATVNNRDNLDEAIQRPGRFDELVEIDRMDETVVKHVLGEYVDGFDIVKEWPIAFILEYTKRRRFQTAEEAATSTKELAFRVARLNRYRPRDDVDRIVSSKETLTEESLIALKRMLDNEEGDV